MFYAIGYRRNFNLSSCIIEYGIDQLFAGSWVVCICLHVVKLTVFLLALLAVWLRLGLVVLV